MRERKSPRTSMLVTGAVLLTVAGVLLAINFTGGEKKIERRIDRALKSKRSLLRTEDVYSVTADLQHFLRAAGPEQPRGGWGVAIRRRHDSGCRR